MEKIVHVSLRLPQSLHDAVVRLAESEHRSMHGQIMHLIEQATGEPDPIKRRRPTADRAERN